MIARTAWEVAATAPWSFLIGAAVGFVAADRWRIIRRNGKGGEK